MLYKRIDGALHFCHAAAGDGLVVFRRGIVGSRAPATQHPLRADEDPAPLLERLLEPARAEGFAPIDLDEQATLLIEYASRDDDPEATDRWDVQAHLDDLLHATGLGECDSCTSGAGSIEVCCFVVDFALAKRVIEVDLRGGQFGNYRRIFRED